MWPEGYVNSRRCASDFHTDILTSRNGSVDPGCARSVAFPESDFSRQTKPGAVSANALMGSSASTNSRMRGSSSGCCRRARLSWARWYAIGPLYRGLLSVDAADIAGDVHVRPVGILGFELRAELRAGGI